MSRLLLVFMLLLIPQIVSAGVIFEDNFNGQADWWPKCLECGLNADGYSNGGIGASSGVPTNWNYWRNDEFWNPDASSPTVGSKPTMVISNAVSGGSDKSFQVWNESHAGRAADGWGADGELAKYLGTTVYPELYVRVKVKFSPTFQYTYNAANAAQIKMLRFYHSDNLNAPFAAFSGGTQGPMVLMKGHWKDTTYPFGFDFQHRCDPQASYYTCGTYTADANGQTTLDGQAALLGGNRSWYGNPDLATFSTTGPNSDGWHVLDYYAKLNSSPGVRDGIIRFWQDGNLMYQRTDIDWIGSSGNMNSGWNVVSIGGNAFNQYSDPANKAEQWYAIDDVVVSTTAIPADYVIGGNTPADPAPPALSTPRLRGFLRGFLR